MTVCRRNVVSGLVGGALLPCLGAPVFAAVGRTARATVKVDTRQLRAGVPDHFLSFNLNSITLDHFHWDPARGELHPDLLEGMKSFPGAIYRYPGGLISNKVNWEWALGPQAQRRAQRGEAWAEAQPIRFGPQEYLDFLSKVGGRSWYTLNLVGWSETETVAELPQDTVAQSNGRLAAWRATNDQTSALPRLYHLGNELDRSVYEWPTDKYIARAKASMDTVRAADKDAGFVAFLRDFDWQNRKRPGSSRASRFAADVLKGLPEVRDVSLQLYYDRPEESEGKVFDIPWRMQLVDKFLNEAQALRPGVRVWVTEHAKAKPASVAQPEWRLASTSGIDGAIASADMCIWLLQRPAIQAAFWHALGGSAWWDLFRPDGRNLRPTPVFMAFDLFRRHAGPGTVMDRRITGSAIGGYSGGYDLNAAVIAGPGPADRVVWMINRANAPATLTVQDAGLAGLRLHAELETLAAGRPTVELAAQFDVAALKHPPRSLSAPADGTLAVELPARCIGALRLRADNTVS